MHENAHIKEGQQQLQAQSSSSSESRDSSYSKLSNM